MKSKHLLYVWRKNHGYTQESLANAINKKFGNGRRLLSSTSICHWESGRVQPLFRAAMLIDRFTDGDVPASYMAAYKANHTKSVM